MITSKDHSSLIGKTISAVIMREIIENPGVKYHVLTFTDGTWCVLTDSEENAALWRKYMENKTKTEQN